MAVSGGGRVPAGLWECRRCCLTLFRRHVFIYRRQNLGMDEEGVQQTAGQPTKKKFFIPLDEDEVPPPGVGRGDGRTAWRLRVEGIQSKGTVGLQYELEHIRTWVTLGNQSFALHKSHFLYL